MTKQELIEDNINLVHFLIGKHYPTFSNDEDIIQSGMVGLCRAANTWDESKSKFSTYACQCILNEIKDEFRSRKKHHGNLSLDYEVNSDEGTVTFGDLIEGDLDIDFVDTEPVMDKLSPVEQDVFSLLTAGVSPNDIGKRYGLSKQRMNNIMRKIRLVWRNYNGN